MKLERILLIAFFLLILCIHADAQRMVKVVYFVPTNRPFQAHIPQELDTQMKAVQNFYANQMEFHGYSNKNFQIETDGRNKLVVHSIRGKFGDVYYHADTLNKVELEIKDRFNDTHTHIYVVVVDISTERIQGNCGIARYEGGLVMIPATGDCVENGEGIELTAHELGHSLNLVHDFRDNAYIMSYGAQRNKVSECAAMLLSVSPFFNDFGNTVDTPATIRMLTPETYLKDAEKWTLKFEVSDPDGIHQVQFEQSNPGVNPGIVTCECVPNKHRATIEFDLPKGATQEKTNSIWIRAVDRNGAVKTEGYTLTSTEKIETDKPFTYLTLGYDSRDALIPANPPKEWGWDWGGWQHTWEKMPDTEIPKLPHQGFVSAQHIPFIDKWDHWFYAHAEGQIIYDLTNTNHTRFDAYFYLPNPCGNVASVEIIGLADGVEIYKSGVIKSAQAQNKQITFDISENTQKFTIKITDGGDDIGCDHYIIANAKLLEPDPETEKQNLAPQEKPRLLEAKSKLVTTWAKLKQSF